MARSGIIDLSNLQTFTAVNLLSDPGNIGGPVVVPQAAQITLNWNLGDGKVVHNVLYGRYAGAFSGSVAQANQIATGLTSGATWTGLAAQLAPTVSFAGVSIRDVNTRDQALINSTNSSVPGTGTGTELPDEAAVVVTLRTALTGRGNRGRMYVPGYATNALGTGNTIAAAAVTATQVWAQNIAPVFTTAGYTFVLGQKARAAYVSPRTGVSHPARPAGTLTFTGAIVRDNHWDSQRRRGLR